MNVYYEPTTTDVRQDFMSLGTRLTQERRGELFDRWYIEARMDARRQALLDYADLLSSPKYTLNYTDAASMLDQIIFLLRRDAGLLYVPQSADAGTEKP